MGTKFGLQYSFFVYSDEDKDIYAHAKKFTLEAERLGYDSVFLMDHAYHAPSIAPPQEPLMEAWTTIAALAANTTTIRLGTLVTANTFRHPSLLAKMGATVDVISKGRLILGIGASGNEPEHESYGIQFPSLGGRMRRLEESVQILDRMWTQDEADFEGKYYSIKGAICSPKPIQKPRPPIMVGGDGERVLLRLVAQYGDWCNLHGEPADVRRKLKVLEDHCEDVGRDPKEIVKSWHGWLVMGEDEADVQRKRKKYQEETSNDPTTLRSYFVCTPSRIAEVCEELVDGGVEYIIVNFRRDRGLEPLQIFAQQVMSKFA